MNYPINAIVANYRMVAGGASNIADERIATIIRSHGVRTDEFRAACNNGHVIKQIKAENAEKKEIKR